MGLISWCFIGESNAGKSTILRALQCFLCGSQIKDETLFCEHRSDNAVELIGHFDELTDAERESPAVRGRIKGDQWIIKKRFWSEAAEGAESSWKELYFSFSAPPDLHRLAGAGCHVGGLPGRVPRPHSSDTKSRREAESGISPGATRAHQGAGASARCGR